MPPHPLITSHTRDALGNTLSVSNRWNATTVSAFEYTYDALNRRTSRLDNGAAQNTYAYNARGELTNACVATASLPSVYEYWHDAIGNRYLDTEGGDTGSYRYFNGRNQPTDSYGFGYYGDVLDWTWTYDYHQAGFQHDPDGNMTFDGTSHYTWDAENRLIAVSNATSTASYAYDHLGRRVTKATLATGSQLTTNHYPLTTIHYTYDNWNLIGETAVTRQLTQGGLPPDILTLLTHPAPDKWAETRDDGIWVYEVTSGEPQWYLYHSAFDVTDSANNTIHIPETLGRLSGSGLYNPVPYPWVPANWPYNIQMGDDWIYDGNRSYYGYVWDEGGSVGGIYLQIYSIWPAPWWSIYLTPYVDAYTSTQNFPLNPNGSMPDYLQIETDLPSVTSYIQYMPLVTTNVTHYPIASASTNTTSYLWGLDLSGTPQGAGGVGGLVAVLGAPNTSSASIYVPAYDANGNVTEYVDVSGNTVAHYEYDAFGNAINQSGPKADEFKFRFSTKYWDYETWLYYYIKRYYAPYFGRFISTDPIGERGGLNLYGFCGNDPINRWDYLGMTTVWDYEDFPGAKRGRLDNVDGCVYTRIMKDKWDGEVRLQRLKRVDIDSEMKRLIKRLNEFERRDGYRSRNYEESFDSAYVFTPEGKGSHYYYFVKEVDKTNIYADHEINYIGIGLYEAWLGKSLLASRTLVLGWKLYSYRTLPTAGAYFWLNYGYRSYGSLQNEIRNQ